MKNRNTLFLLFALLFCIGGIMPAAAQGTINNDTFWRTTSGEPIYSQGGGVFRFTDPQTGRERYYWYGVQYSEAALYLANPTTPYRNCTFEGVTCYVSDDLVNWTSLGLVLTADEVTAHTPAGWLGRMGVAKVGDTYALLIQYNKHLLLCESKTPAGQFTWSRLIDMTSLTGTTGTGDQTVFTDEDTGRSYLVCSRPGGRNHLYICGIGTLADGSIGLTDCTEVFSGAGREGNCMFKRGGKFYLCASNLYGWDGSYAYFLVADDVHGPYRPIINGYKRPVNDYPDDVTSDMQVMPGCEADYSHVSQTGFFYTLRNAKGQELVLFCGDRWSDFAGNGLGYNQWVPLSFDGDVPHFNSLSSWTLDAKNATWTAAPANNWCLNPSFEADRRIIPSGDKPRQDFLTGWNTKVIKGSASGIPLNHDKPKAETRNTIGEKTLLVTDTVVFHRRVSQTVTGTHAAPLPNGDYRMEVRIKTVGDIHSSYIYVTSGSKTVKTPIIPCGDWTTVTIPSATIQGGKAEIGFDIQGAAGGKMLADDVLLVKK